MRIHNFILVAATLSTPALAFPQHVDNIPNGNVVATGSTRNCQHCHINSGGGQPWNELGKDFLEQGGANPEANPNDMNAGYNFPSGPLWDEDICTADSDGDGFTNGEELGDPDCIWTPGDTPTRTTDISNAGNPDSVPGGAEGEGEGEGEDVIGGCSAGAPASLFGLVALVALLRRRN